MKLQITASLALWEGGSFFTGGKRLEVSINFSDPFTGRKVNLKEEIVRGQLISMDQFISRVRETLEDDHFVKTIIERAVHKWLNDTAQKKTNKKELNELHDLVKNKQYTLEMDITIDEE